MVKGSTMGKDPGVSWVFNDWQGGTMTLSRHQKGCYMDLLTAQFNNGHLSLEEIKTVLGSDFGSSWPTLQKKFKVDSDNLFFNERLEFEITKRKSFNKTRRDNAKSNKSEPILDEHMGNGNNTTSTYFKLKEKIIKTNVSDYIKSNLQIWLDNQKRLDTVDIVEKGLIEIDKEYFAHSFADENHIKSSLKLICKKLKTEVKTDNTNVLKGTF